jgi:PAS domain S-box-containing protein
MQTDPLDSGSVSRVQDQIGLPLSLIERLAEGVAVVDLQGQFLILNRAAAGLFGLSEATRSLEGARMGSPVYRENEREPLPPEEWPLARVLSGEAVACDILRVEHPRDGGESWVSAQCFPLLDANDALVGAAAIFTELTPQRFQERPLQKPSGSGDGHSTLKTISRDLAHELNQPLTTISLYARGCIRRVKSGWREEDEMLEALEAIHEQALRAGDLIRRAREFSPWAPLQTTHMNLNTVLRDMEESARSRAFHGGCSFEIHAEPDLPDCAVDLSRIQDLLWRVTELGIDAARVASDSPVVVWSTHAHDEMVELRITGSATHVPTATEILAGAKATESALCLTICRRIAEELGGRIEFHGDEHGGMHAQLLLPISSEVHGHDARAK